MVEAEKNGSVVKFDRGYTGLDVQKSKREKTWTLVETKEQFIEAVKTIRAYLKQENAILGVDCETSKNPKWNPPDRKFPVWRPIWMGNDIGYQGYLESVQIGFDPTNRDYDIRDQQFIFPVRILGVELLAAGLKDILENNTCLGHNIKYDYEYLKVFLDIEMRHMIDTMLMNKVFKAGHKVGNALDECYMQYIPVDEFKQWSGVTTREDHESDPFDVFKRYRRFKKKMQVSDWTQPFSFNQQRYQSDDVRMPFLVLSYMLEQMDKFSFRYEKRLLPGQGLQGTLQIEFQAISAIADAELRGWRFNRKYHREYVIPLLERERENAIQALLEFPEFHARTVDREILLRQVLPTGKTIADMPDVKLLAGELRKHLKEKFPGVKFSVKTDSKKLDGKRVSVSWAKTEKFEFKTLRRRPVWESIKPLVKPGHVLINNTCINPGSSQQLKAALQKALGVTIPNTEEVTLLEYLGEHPCIDKVLDFKKAHHLCNTYGRKLLKHATPLGFIHCNWNQVGQDESGTGSGRLISAGPNLQQLPARFKLFARPGFAGYDSSKLFRRLMIAPKGCILVVADFSQIEPRLTAHWTKDEKMLWALLHNKDLHGLAAQAFLSLDEIPRKKDDGGSDEEDFQRSYIGKTGKLARGYGSGVRTFIQFMFKATHGVVKLEYNEAKAMLKAHDEFYAGETAMRKRVQRRVYKKPLEEGGLAKWKGGRVIHVQFSLPAIDSKGKCVGGGRPRTWKLLDIQDRMPDELLEEDYRPEDCETRFYYNQFRRRLDEIAREAYNHTIQSSCADIFKIAIYRVNRALKKAGITGKHGIVGFSHDELILCVPQERGEECAQILQNEMRKAAELVVKAVPIKIGAKCGRSWHAAK